MISSVKITAALPGTTIAPEYSTFSAFSFLNKYLLLTHPKGFMGLYSGDGLFLTLLPSEVNTNSSPRWSRTDSNRLTYTAGNVLKSLVMGVVGPTMVRYIEHAFPEYIEIDDRGEADVSLDRDHRVFAGTSRGSLLTDVFAYQLSTGLKGLIFPQTETFDGLKLTSSNDIIVSRATGIFVLSPIGPHQRQLTTANGHACIGRDSNGDDILLWTNSNENPVTLPKFPNGVVKIRIADGKQTGLISFPWTDAVDIAMPEGGDACYVSTYGASEGSGRLYQVALDGTLDTLLLDGINHDVKSYDGQPKFSVSWDGSRGVYAATEPDGVTVNTWMVRLDGLPVKVPVIPPEPVSKYPGFQLVPPTALGGKHFLIDLAPDGTFTEYIEIP